MDLLGIPHELLLACRDLVNHLRTAAHTWRCCVNPRVGFPSRSTSHVVVRRWSHHGGIRRCLGVGRRDTPRSLANTSRLWHRHTVRPWWDWGSDVIYRVRLLIHLAWVAVEGLWLLRRVDLDVSLNRKASRGMVMNVLWCSSVYELLLLLLLLLRLLLKLGVKDVAWVLILVLR